MFLSETAVQCVTARLKQQGRVDFTCQCWSVLACSFISALIDGLLTAKHLKCCAPLNLGLRVASVTHLGGGGWGWGLGGGTGSKAINMWLAACLLLCFCGNHPGTLTGCPLLTNDRDAHPCTHNHYPHLLNHAFNHFYGMFDSALGK